MGRDVDCKELSSQSNNHSVITVDVDDIRTGKVDCRELPTIKDARYDENKSNTALQVLSHPLPKCEVDKESQKDELNFDLDYIITLIDPLGSYWEKILLQVPSMTPYDAPIMDGEEEKICAGKKDDFAKVKLVFFTLIIELVPVWSIILFVVARRKSVGMQVYNIIMTGQRNLLGDDCSSVLHVYLPACNSMHCEGRRLMLVSNSVAAVLAI